MGIAQYVPSWKTDGKHGYHTCKALPAASGQQPLVSHMNHCPKACIVGACLAKAQLKTTSLSSLLLPVTYAMPDSPGLVLVTMRVGVPHIFTLSSSRHLGGGSMCEFPLAVSGTYVTAA